MLTPTLLYYVRDREGVGVSKRCGKAIDNLHSCTENIRATPVLERFLLGLTIDDRPRA